jgi:hypothetical protein
MKIILFALMALTLGLGGCGKKNATTLANGQVSVLPSQISTDAQ